MNATADPDLEHLTALARFARNVDKVVVLLLVEGRYRDGAIVEVRPGLKGKATIHLAELSPPYWSDRNSTVVAVMVSALRAWLRRQGASCRI